MIPFDEVVRRHGPTVLRVCRAVVGPDLADDAWSETFLAALRAYPRLPPDANVEAWLVTIAHRKAIDQLRGVRRRPVPTDEVPELVTSDDRVQDATRELAEALAPLTPRQRQALAYHHVAGLPYAEVAEIIGGTPAAVRRAAADGLAILRSRHTRKDLS